MPSLAPRHAPNAASTMPTTTKVGQPEGEPPRRRRGGGTRLGAPLKGRPPPQPYSTIRLLSSYIAPPPGPHRHLHQGRDLLHGALHLTRGGEVWGRRGVCECVRARSRACRTTHVRVGEDRSREGISGVDSWGRVRALYVCARAGRRLAGRRGPEARRGRGRAKVRGAGCRRRCLLHRRGPQQSGLSPPRRRHLRSMRGTGCDAACAPLSC